MAQDSRPTYTLVTAGILVVLYVAASWYMFAHFASEAGTDVGWQRGLIIYNGVASVGFTAIGVLLGTSVQQASTSASRSAAESSRLDAARKGAAIKTALDVSNSELGGGTLDETRRAEAVRQALMQGLS